MRDEKPSNFLMPALAGLAVGALLGVLFAPRSGKKTRRMVRERISDLQEDAGALADVGKAAMNAACNSVAEHKQGQRDDLDDVARFLMDEGMHLLDSLSAETADNTENGRP